MGLFLQIEKDVNKMSESEFASYIEYVFSIPVISEYRRDTSFQPEADVSVTIEWDCNNGYDAIDCAVLRLTSEKSNVEYQVLLLSNKLKGSKHKISALHEVGHSFEIDEKEVVSKEVDAWNFAEREAKKMRLNYNRLDVKSMIGTYIMKYNEVAAKKIHKLVVFK